MHRARRGKVNNLMTGEIHGYKTEMKYGEGCERMEQENGRKEKQKTTEITLRMIIRHDDVRGGRDDDDDGDDSNNSDSW